MNTAENLPEDAVYYLDYDLISTTHESQYLKGIIDEHGYFEVSGARVYTPALAAFLTSESVEVKIIIRKKYDHKTTTVDNTVHYEHTLIRKGENRPGVICGCDYIASYIDGYAEGVKWFNETYAPGPTILYGPRADSYIATLRHLCFSEPFGFLHSGVVGVKGVMPVIIDHGGIKRIGYYSGIVAAVEKLVALHQPLFEQLQELKVNAVPTDQNLKEKEQTPALTPDELQPQLTILSTMQTRLYKTLSEHVSAEQHAVLEQLLTNGCIGRGNRVWVKLRADSLAYIFKQAREAENMPIMANMIEMATWLAAYVSYGKTNSKPVSQSTVYKVLRGNTEVSKPNQKRLKA